MPSTNEYDRGERTEQRRPFSDSTASAPSSTSDPEKVPEANRNASTDEELQKAPWRALFFFTTQSNVPILILGIFASIFAGAVPAFNAYIQGQVFKSFTDLAAGAVTGQEVYDNDKKYVLYFVALGGASWVAHSVEFTAWLTFGELQAKSARDRLFNGLLEREIEWYDLRNNGIGALLPRLQAQIRDLQLATSQPLGLMAQAVSTLVFSLAEAFYFGWDLTLVTMSTVPVIIGAVIWISAGTQRAIDAQQAKLIEAQKYTNSAFSSIETVKCFNGQDVEREKYEKKLAEAGAKHHRIANMAGLMMGCMVFLGSTIFVQGFYYGGVLIDKEKKTTADVMTCFLSAIAAFSAIQAAMPQILVLEKGRAAGATLRKIMAEVAGESSARHSTALTRPPACHGNIDVRNVSFAYPSRPGQLALDNVTLSIPGGDMTFLIGKSGSGKSTLSQLLLRFYSFSEGSITVDGVPLALLDVAWLRTNFALVEQTSLLFNDTVFQNIAFGRHDHENVTKGEVMEAVEFALLQLMISDMPKGLDTLVGHKGGAMSGGQRQRMALARARLRDSPILMLDESTSALDHISRALMMDAIRQWRHGKTTIIITHDISQILPDDYAYVLDQGRLVQEGFRKHMEKMKDTPFQSFLAPEDRATISSYDARKPTNFESIYTRGSSLDDASMYSFNGDEGRTSDPLEVQLRAGENKRTSFLPPAFTEGGLAAGMRGPAMRGATSAFASPFLRMTVSPPTLPALLTKWGPGSSPSTPTSERGSTTDSPVDQRKAFRMTTMLENLVDRTGRQAADARAVPESVAHRVRRPVHDEPLAKLTGNAASKTPDDEESLPADHVRQRSLKHLMYTLWPSLDGFSRTLLVMGFICGVIHAVASPLFSYIFSKLLTTYSIPQGRAHKTLVYSMTMLGIAAADGISTYFFRYLLECVGQRWVDSLRSEAIKRILDQPREFFDQELNTVGRLTEGLDRNAEVMRDLLGRFTGMMFVAALISLISIAWALSAQWKFTLICLTAAPYVFLVTNAFSAVSARWETISTDASESAGTIFVETFTNIKTVRALTLEGHFVDKYTVATNYALRVGFMRALFSAFFFGMSDSAATFSTALIFYVGSLLARDGGPKSIAALLQVTAILVFAITNVSAILAFVPQINGAKDSGSRLLRLAQLPERSHEHLGDTRIVAVGNIQFIDLNFAYPSRPEFRTLRDINLRIKPGISTAIVGGSGSGKSTIANLLLNLYSTATTPTKAGKLGDLTLAGRDIKQIHTPSLRALIVVVPQMPTVFAATVAENIAYGLAEDSPYNNLASITKAAQSAGIHDFIATLPSAYNTLIGDGGIGLSGGQAQRVAIARALVRNPSVLILDEATSALDVESASLVRDTIKSLLDNKSRSMTVIIITHSREQMEIADHIVVLDHGIIVEEGGFYELLQKDGPLKNLLSGGEWDAGREEEGNKRKARPRGGPMMGDVNWKRRSRAPRRLRM